MTRTAEIVIYEGADARVEVRVEREDVWLSLQQLAALFGRDKSVISRHLRNVFASGELERGTTVAKNATVQREGEREVVRDIECYNLDAIISVGYRVNSSRATRFRQWTTRMLREHLTQGTPGGALPTLHDARAAARRMPPRSCYSVRCARRSTSKTGAKKAALARGCKGCILPACGGGGRQM